jgi:peptide/nickel transport system substrate-binding protein
MAITRRAALAGGLAAPFVLTGRAEAQAPSRKETLLLVQEYGPNSLDMQGIGASQPVNGVALNCYDRLLRFKPVPIPGGGGHQVSMGELEGELAESWQIASDGMSCTFKLRDARFHSGRKVTARDVKWSLDRALAIGGFATTQMNAGSLEKPEQFVVVDDRTFRVDFLRKDKMTMPNLAVTIPFVIDSELAIRNSGGDPLAKEWLKNNVAGSGAYKVESWKPGTETIYVRNDDWACGKLPAIRRIIARDIPSASTRRALMERGDADVSYGLPPKDFKDLSDGGKINVVGVPIPNGVWGLYLNSQVGPFKDVRLRQAVAWVTPYEKILQASLFGRGVDMSGGPETPKPAWPTPFAYKTNVAKAKELVAAAGGGFKTTLQFDAGNATVAEPMAVLLKEALGAIGIDVEIAKIPGANFRAEIAKKTNPMTLNRFAGWLDYPDYYLFWTMHGNNSIFNIANYQNPELDKLIDAARFASDPAVYEKTVVDFIRLVGRETPMVPIAQPTHDVALQKTIDGYQFQPCREPDFRYLTKA